MSHGRCIDKAIELPGMDDRAQPVECPCMALGLAVLYRAWIDALDRRCTRTEGDARRWWSMRSRGLREWCAALGLDLEWVVTRAQRRIREYDQGDQATRTRIRGHAEYLDRDTDDAEIEEMLAAPDGSERTAGARRQRAYYLRHRDHLLSERKRKRAARQSRAQRMEERFPGYADRHQRNTSPEQDGGNT